MFFPIKSLPLELALEIIRLAASPDIQANNTQSPVPMYHNAKALCLVSHGFREVTMPHLLHTVILADTGPLHYFTRALQMQAEWHKQRSRLALDYSELVCHFWCSRFLINGFPSGTGADGDAYTLKTDALDAVVRNARTVGFNFNALYLLCDIASRTRTPAFGERPDPNNRGWRCKRLTLAGMGIRWNPLTSSRQGLAFLAGLTHLTLWCPNIHKNGPPGAVPYWLAGVPLEDMHNLTHLAFSLNHTDGSTSMDVLVYVRPSGDAFHTPSKQGHIFRRWAASANPLEFGTVVKVNLSNIGAASPVPDHCFELAFLRAAAAAKVRY